MLMADVVLPPPEGTVSRWADERGEWRAVLPGAALTVAVCYSFGRLLLRVPRLDRRRAAPVGATKKGLR